MNIKITQLLHLLVEPSSKIQGEKERHSARMLLTMQLGLFVLMGIRDLLEIFVIDTVIPPYISLLILFTYLICRISYYRLSTFLLALVFNGVPYYTIFVSTQLITNQNLFASLAWIPLIILLLSYFQNSKSIIILSIANLITILFFPIFSEVISIIDVGYSVGLIFSFSFTIVIGTILRNRTSRKIENQKVELEVQQEELEVLTSIIGHDLKNDIGVIMGTIQYIEMNSSEICEDISNGLRMIKAGGERIINMITLLSTEPKAIRMNIFDLLNSIAKRAMKIHATLQVQLIATDPLPKGEYVVSYMLPLVFENLLRNAAVYAGDNPKVTIKIQFFDNFFYVDVLDNGPGIDPEIKSRLFTRGASLEGEGRGLGLYLSKKVVESQGGSIELVEEYKEGAKFRVKLKII